MLCQHLLNIRFLKAKQKAKGLLQIKTKAKNKVHICKTMCSFVNAKNALYDDGYRAGTPAWNERIYEACSIICVIKWYGTSRIKGHISG